jgi:hypothetical protein
MTDLSITAANVVAGANAVKRSVTAGEAVTQGQPVAHDPTTQKWVKADCNSATEALRKAGGIALNAASLNQPLVVHTWGDITIGATLTAGSRYYLSATAGGIMPEADLTTGDYVCLLGLAKSTSVLAVDIQFPNVVLL